MAKSPIQEWLDSKDRNYADGVKLYAAHPTALRMLVVNLQRKQTAQMEEKLVYVLEKALAADGAGTTEVLKKKETTKPAPKKKATKGKKKTNGLEIAGAILDEAKGLDLGKPTPEEEPLPPMGDPANHPFQPAEEVKEPEPPANPE